MTVDATVIESLRQSVSRPDGASAKYMRLETALSEMIEADQLRPGAQFPADKKFAEQIGLSLGTVQKALGNLQKKGFLDRAPKRGTAVAERQVGERDIFTFRFRDPGTGQLIPPRVRTLTVSEERTKGPWTRFLGAGRIVCVERILQVGVEPPVYSQVHLPDVRGASLLGQPMDTFDGFSIHRHMERHHGAPTLRSENKIGIGAFTDRAAQMLNLNRGTPALVWDIASYTVGDDPAVFQRIQIPPDHRPIEFRRTHAD